MATSPTPRPQPAFLCLELMKASAADVPSHAAKKPKPAIARPHMERISVGMVSAGSNQVVALGPNWPQKDEKKYRNCRTVGTGGERLVAATSMTRVMARHCGRRHGAHPFSEARYAIQAHSHAPYDVQRTLLQVDKLSMRARSVTEPQGVMHACRNWSL